MIFTFNNREYELLVIHVSGSRLYGNSTETSDWDYRGIILAKNSDKLGLFDKTKMLGGETGKGKSGEMLCKALIKAGIPLKDTDDVQLYEVSNFIDLAINNNPNIMDTLCYDYNTESTAYISDKGKWFLDQKSLFLSRKLKFTFSGYAIAQLHKIKSHNKWINEFPDTTEVLEILKKNFQNNFIDFNWIVENFGGGVAERITNENAQQNNTIPGIPTWEYFKEVNSDCGIDFDKYQIPRLYDFCKAIDIHAKILDKDAEIAKVIKPEIGNHFVYKTTIKKLMIEEGSFRTLGNSMYSLFTDGTGLFGKEGNIKANDPNHTGEFICLVKANPDEYKKIKDHVNNMWNWKLKRNEARGELEDQFGYDTKHASHLVRLLMSARSILEKDDYTPELSGDTLQLVKDVRAGKFSYNWVLEFSEKLDTELSASYETSTLQHKPNLKKINEVLIKIQGL